MRNEANTQDTEVVGPRHRGLWALLIVVAVAAVAVLGTIALRENNRPGYRSSQSGTLRDDARRQGAEAIGTAGARKAAATDADAEVSPAVIRELETITGVVDAHQLIGRKVHLDVPVLDKANDQAFWVGSNENRVLVVPRRDHRDSAERQRGLIAGNGIAAMQTGQQASISGVIQKLPNTEDMYSWGLTNADKREVADRGIYVRADTVSVNDGAHAPAQ